MSSNPARVSDVIADLKNQRKLNSLVKIGVLASKYVTFYKINKRLEELIESKGKTTMKIILCEQVADEFRVGIRTVYRARNVMNLPCQSSDT